MFIPMQLYVYFLFKQNIDKFKRAYEYREMGARHLSGITRIYLYV